MRPTLAPFGWAIALHVAIAGLLLVSFVLPEEELPPQGLQIEAVIVNQAVLQAAASLRKEDERKQERQAALQRKEEERIARIETEKRAVEERRIEADEAERRKTQAAAEARRKAEADAKLKAEQQARAKAAAEQKRKAEREADLRARLAEEEERTGAAFQSLKAQYVAALQAHVERRWFKPPGTPLGATCVAFVTQIPGGEVVAVRFGTCNGGEAFRQSVENAIRNASPLPPPPQPALFEREVRLVFKSEE
ncbi:MAG: cell envelope integrity protein TolA [Gammaproteobacteria bacterium]|nr:cell envelope integrity protein TolA [Gammaproteobacteria bacterium]